MVELDVTFLNQLREDASVVSQNPATMDLVSQCPGLDLRLLEAAALASVKLSVRKVAC